jgi:hypothetical protein
MTKTEIKNEFEKEIRRICAPFDKKLIKLGFDKTLTIDAFQEGIANTNSQRKKAIGNFMLGKLRQ